MLTRTCGIGRAGIVAGLLPRIPELLTVALGCWRAGAVCQRLFTAFWPKAIETRIGAGGGSGAKLVVTDGANRSKLAEVAGTPPIIEVDRAGQGAGCGGGGSRPGAAAGGVSLSGRRD